MELYKTDYFVGDLKQTVITTRKLTEAEILAYVKDKWYFLYNDEIDADDIVGVTYCYGVGERGDLLWESCEY